jgi:tetratricopeptide (TPR) repeat protein
MIVFDFLMADERLQSVVHPSVKTKTLCGRRVFLTVAVLLLLGTIVLLWWYSSATPKSGLEAARRLVGKPEQALKLVRSHIQATRGDDPEAQLFECRLLLELRRGSEAERRFKQIHRIETCDPASLYEVAVRATAANRLSLARQALAAAGEFVHHDPKRIKLLIFVLYTLHDGPSESRILELCKEYANLVPADAFPWLISSSLHRELNSPQLAFDAYREAIKRQLSPDETETVQIQIVELSLVLGDLATARENFDALVQTSRTSAVSSQLLDLQTQLLYREGKLDDLMKLLDEALKKQPQLTSARAFRGKCREELGDHAGAIDDLQKVVRENDYDQSSHYLLGQAYLNQKDVSRGQVHLNRSRELIEINSQIMTVGNQLRNDPQNREFKLRLVELYEKRGNHEKALAWKREAHVSAPKQP